MLWYFFSDTLPWLWVVAFVCAIPGMYAMVKGAPFVPTSKRTLRTMFELANVKPGEHVYDLGCGDGRFIIEAAKRGAIATGYEFSLPTFLLAWIRCLPYKNARVRFANFWKLEYKNADVIFCYLLVETMGEFEKTIWPTLPKGCRVVSHAFRMKNVRATKEQDGAALYIR